MAAAPMVPPLAIFTGMPGLPEMAIFAVIVLVLFGKRLPGAMKSLGQSVGALKEGLHESSQVSIDDGPAAPPVAPAPPAGPTAST